MPDQPRAIVHLDLDAFFAAVEVLESPELGVAGRELSPTHRTIALAPGTGAEMNESGGL
jgi:hypothetical protein